MKSDLSVFFECQGFKSELGKAPLRGGETEKSQTFVPAPLRINRWTAELLLASLRWSAWSCADQSLPQILGTLCAQELCLFLLSAGDICGVCLGRG